MSRQALLAKAHKNEVAEALHEHSTREVPVPGDSDFDPDFHDPLADPFYHFDLWWNFEEEYLGFYV